jgi:hypothetical protein
MTDTTDNRASWRRDDWLKAAGYPFSHVTLYKEIRAGRIDARKAGKNLVILTTPRDYLMSLPRKMGVPWGRGRKRTAA